MWAARISRVELETPSYRLAVIPLPFGRIEFDSKRPVGAPLPCVSLLKAYAEALQSSAATGKNYNDFKRLLHTISLRWFRVSLLFEQKVGAHRPWLPCKLTNRLCVCRLGHVKNVGAANDP